MNFMNSSVESEEPHRTLHDAVENGLKASLRREAHDA